MSHLLIKCKECKAIVDTGVSMDFASFCSSEFENEPVACQNRSCAKEQVWSRDFAFVSPQFEKEKQLDNNELSRIYKHVKRELTNEMGGY